MKTDNYRGSLDPQAFRRRREELHLTQEELGELAGLNRSLISKIERGGRTNLTTRTMLRLASALMTSADSLLRKPVLDDAMRNKVEEISRNIAEMTPDELDHVLEFILFQRQRRSTPTRSE